ncbi:hypothetical protein QIA25_05360 (plasmid) [Borreliella spielmanii]|uniref:hypothetical protein n=1 Tax=Borreliella spielmanii TaxID=88916 RepID=UPI001F52B29D|nr:hypothetical protein [Borreliella spielmanii]
MYRSIKDNKFIKNLLVVRDIDNKYYSLATVEGLDSKNNNKTKDDKKEVADINMNIKYLY